MGDDKLARHHLDLAVAVFLAIVVSMVLPFFSDAQNNPNIIQTPRFTLHVEEEGQTSKKRNFSNKTEFAFSALAILETLADELNRIFSYRPQRPVVLRFLTPKEFADQTGAPPWTSAMFFRGEIIVPLSESNFKDRSELYRALRHEYTHAVIADISDYSSPAWLDEGLAQIIEGAPHPAVGPALRKWLSGNEIMPLEWLESGFMRLDPKIVPAAYGESLFIARHLVNTYGIKRVVNFLSELGKGTATDSAFDKAFGTRYASFSHNLNQLAIRWSSSGATTP